MTEDADIVQAQLGHAPATGWRVGHRCSHGHPSVIVNAPQAFDGTPFPTLYWLTCPHLIDVVAERESAGATHEWTARIASDAHTRFEVLACNEQYRAAREIEAGGEDPCGDVGIAGQRDPYATKCLHAHVATFMAGIPDPIGRETLEALPLECADDECASLLVRYGSSS